MRFACAAAAAAALATTAAAQDPNFEGRWRFVKAEIAPWANPGSTPDWLRYGLVVGDGALKGPGPWACAPATFETIYVERDGLFEGAVGETGFDPSKYGIGDGSTVTLRVTCPNAGFDMHQAGDGELVTAMDGVIYVLRRSEPEMRDSADPDSFVARIEPGFDCAAAGNAGERAICEWPDALAADHEMTRHSVRLAGEISAPLRDDLATAHRGFLAYRASACGFDSAPSDVFAERDLARCAQGLTGLRAQFLAGLAVASAGSIRIEPRIFTESALPVEDGDAAMSGWFAQDARPILFGASPAAAAAFERSAGAMRPLKPAAPGDFRGALTRVYEVVGLSDRWISVAWVTTVETGVAVPVSNEGFNLDLKTGATFGVADVFDGSPGWRDAVLSSIRSQVNDPDALADRQDDVLSGTGAVLWSFALERAVVQWTPHSSGPPEHAEIRRRRWRRS